MSISINVAASDLGVASYGCNGWGWGWSEVHWEVGGGVPSC